MRSYRHHHHLPALAQLTTIDRKAAKYLFQNPYLYCAANPIMFIDPTGLDNIYIDCNGRYNRTEATDDDYDMIYILNKDGEKVSGIGLAVDKGAINVNVDNEYTQKHSNHTVYEASNSKDGMSFFKFLATHTDIEYTLIPTKKDGNSASITTSHQKDCDMAGSNYIDYLYKTGTVVEGDIVHNHPDLSPYPSGMIYGKADVGFAAKVNNMYKNVSYSIYMRDTGIFIPYNEYSKESYYKPNLNQKTFIRYVMRLSVKIFSQYDYNF